MSLESDLFAAVFLVLLSVSSALAKKRGLPHLSSSCRSHGRARARARVCACVDELCTSLDDFWIYEII